MANRRRPTSPSPERPLVPSGQARQRPFVPPKKPGQANTNRVFTIVLLGVIAAMIAGGVVFVRSAEQPSAETPVVGVGAEQLVRDNSHRLTTADDGKVTLVEFLDFECEACRAAFPTVEQVRSQYAGQITLVVRYFPIDSHFNAQRAARAVEAAAQQGQFEAMYKKMYETQTQWGEQQAPMDDVFRGFALELGLDMATWDADYNAPATVDRIKADVADGTALGVQGTPTFFLNGERLEPRSADDLTAAIDAALAS